MRSSAAIFLFAVSLLSLGSLNLSTSAAEDVKEEVKIGWIGPLSGNAAILGNDALTAARLVVDETNLTGGIQGHPIKLIVEDDQMSAKQTVSSFRKLTEQDGVQVIMTYSYSGLFSIAAMAQRAGAVLIDPLDCDEDIAKLPDNVFCVAKLTEEFGRKLAEDIVQLGVLPTGVLYYTSDEFPVKVAANLRGRLKELGKDLSFDESYSAEERDFRSYFLRAREKGLQSIAILGELEVGVALKQAREMNFPGQIYTLSTILGPDIQKIAGDAVNGTRIVDWAAEKSPEYDKFLSKFRLRTSREPVLQVSTVPSYDVMKLIVQALRQTTESAGVETSAQTVKRFFSTVKNYAGASGKITIDPDGCTRSLHSRIDDVANRVRVSP